MYFCSMIKEFQLQVFPEQACKPELLINIVAKKLQIEEVEITHLEILKRSTDARQKIVKINLKLRVCVSEKHIKEKEYLPVYKDANGKEEKQITERNKRRNFFIYFYFFTNINTF